MDKTHGLLGSRRATDTMRERDTLTLHVVPAPLPQVSPEIPGVFDSYVKQWEGPKDGVPYG